MRLVNRKQYVSVEGRFYSFIVAGTVTLGLGMILLFATLGLCVNFWGNFSWGGLLIISASVGATVFLLITALKMLARASEVENVEIVTPQNAHLLPLEKSLVRASDLPSSEQQTELLRAARSGEEAFPEQLLRATQENRPD